MSSPDIPRGTYKGERVGKPLTDEAEHFIRCCCGRCKCDEENASIIRHYAWSLLI
jgi:hypothetical protein